MCVCVCECMVCKGPVGYVHGVCLCVAQCVLGCSSQPIEVNRSIIKACHWLVHEQGRPIRDTDVRSEWKRVREAVKWKREWEDKKWQSLGLRVREMQRFKDRECDVFHLLYMSVLKGVQIYSAEMLLLSLALCPALCVPFFQLVAVYLTRVPQLQ